VLPCPNTLHIANVRLHWSTAYPGWRLQSVNSLNGPVPLPFQNTSNTPAIVNSRYTETNEVIGIQRVYRLKQ